MTGKVASTDTVSLSGLVVGKREEDGRGMVECELVVEKQGANLTLEVIGTGVAVVPMRIQGTSVRWALSPPSPIVKAVERATGERMTALPSTMGSVLEGEWNGG